MAFLRYSNPIYEQDIFKNQLLHQDMQRRTSDMLRLLVPIPNHYSSGGQDYLRLNCNACQKRIDKEQQYYGGLCIRCAYEKSPQEAIRERLRGVLIDQSGCMAKKSTLRFVALPAKAEVSEPIYCDFVMIGSVRTCGTHGIRCENL